jgi:hypothetical protein
VPYSGVIAFDGAGSDDQGRTNPAALVTFLRHVATTSYGTTGVNALWRSIRTCSRPAGAQTLSKRPREVSGVPSIATRPSAARAGSEAWSVIHPVALGTVTTL